MRIELPVLPTKERHAAILRLLEIRYDGFPDVHRNVQSVSGFVNAKGRISCPDCLANTPVWSAEDPYVDRTRFGCETCGGRGYIDVKRERDPYAINVVTPYGADGAKHEADRERVREIARLKAQTRPAHDVDEAAEANALDYAWKRDRDRLYAKYHLAELELAIEWLRLHFPGVKLRGGCGSLSRLATENGPSGCFALGYFDMVLPDPLRAPPKPQPVTSLPPQGRGVGKRILSQRDKAIVSAIGGGAPTAHVASSFGISVSQVNRIVKEAA